MMALIGGGAFVPSWIACGAFTSLFGAFVYTGTGAAEKVNSVCLLVAIASYVMLVGFGMGGVDAANLLRTNWGAALGPLPIMVVAFTFHNMIPSLMAYLGSRALTLKAVIWGSIIPLGLYTLWQGVIMGTIGGDPASLTSADQIMGALKASAGANAEMAIRVFSFFAIITSFLGVALGCVDFVAEVIGSSRSKQDKARSSPKVSAQTSVGSDGSPSKFRRRGVPLFVMTIPALLVAVLAPKAFLPALEYSGTLRLILFGMMPAIMVWKVRAGGNGLPSSEPWVKGGKSTLVGVVGFAAGVITMELGGKLLRAFAGAV